MVPLVVAVPVSPRHAQGNGTYTPLVLVLICVFLIFFAFLAAKLVYMKHRRIATIHFSPTADSPSELSTMLSHRLTSGYRLKKNRAHVCQGLLVGIFGSPRWETRIKVKVDKETWVHRHSSLAYRFNTGSEPSRPVHLHFGGVASSNSRATGSTSYFSLRSVSRNKPLTNRTMTSGPSRMLTYPGQRSRKSVGLLPRCRSFPARCHMHDDVLNVGHVNNNSQPPLESYLSPSTRLADPSDRNSLFTFLSEIPQETTLSSPLMGTRDSLLLSKSQVRPDRRPIPALPPLPPCQPATLSDERHPCPNQSSTKCGDYLPPFQFSPPTSTHSLIASPEGGPQGHATVTVKFISKSDSSREHCLSVDDISLPVLPDALVHVTKGAKRELRSGKSRFRSHRISSPPLRSPLIPEDAELTSPMSEEITRNKEIERLASTWPAVYGGGIAFHHPLQHYRTKNSGCYPDNFVGLGVRVTPFMSNESTPILATNAGNSPTDQVSVRTPLSELLGDIDVGIFGLERFYWDDSQEEGKLHCAHAKNDSMALVPL